MVLTFQNVSLCMSHVSLYTTHVSLLYELTMALTWENFMLYTESIRGSEADGESGGGGGADEGQS